MAREKAKTLAIGKVKPKASLRRGSPSASTSAQTVSTVLITRSDKSGRLLSNLQQHIFSHPASHAGSSADLDDIPHPSNDDRYDAAYYAAVPRPDDLPQETALSDKSDNESDNNEETEVEEQGAGTRTEDVTVQIKAKEKRERVRSNCTTFACHWWLTVV